MKDKDLLKLLKKNGWKIVRINGSHHVLQKNGKTTVKEDCTMLFVYPAIFHKEEDSYWVEFPDLEGCHTYGTSITDTMEAAQEALSVYLFTLLEQGKTIASPSDISSLPIEDGFSTLVSCDINQYKDTKAVKKTLTIPSWLNDRAVSMGINFSRTLQEALLSKIQV